MQTLWQDMRYGFRRLIKRPGFALIAVLSLALGIGANTAIFSLVNVVLFRPLPIANPAEVVSVSLVGKGGQIAAFSYPNYIDFRDRNEVLSGLFVSRFTYMSLSRNGNNERIWGNLVSGNYFDVLGVKPALGRTFLPEEDKTRLSHPVVVISHALWQTRFGGDPSVVDSDVLINGRKFKVIGVTPSRFKGTDVIYTPEVYVPFAMQKWIEPENDFLDNRASQGMFATGRLKPGVSAAQAEASLNILAAQLAKEFPDNNEGLKVQIIPPGFVVPEFRAGMLGISAALMGLVALVLLIACVNLANLLLARATERGKEIAIRLSIGAGRARIIRQLLTESVMLAVVGGLAGVALAQWIIDLIMALKPPINIPFTLELSLDWRVLVFSMIVSVITGVLFGLVPALQSTKPDLIPALKDVASQSGGRRSPSFMLRSGLVVTQVAVSLLLLIAAGLTLRALQRLRAMNPGFNPENALMMNFDLGLQGYQTDAGVQLRKQLLSRVESLPGVKSASITDFMPLSMAYNSNGILIEGRPQERGANRPTAMTGSAGLKYFETMGTPLVAGRDLTEQDQEGKTRSVVVNETFAHKFFPGANSIEDALGKQFRTSPEDRPWQIAGVAKDGKYWSIGEDPEPFVWYPIGNQLSFNYLLVRTSAKPETLIGAILGEFRNLDANLPVIDAKTLTEHMKLSLFPARAFASLLSAFGMLALALAAIGLFGVMSYSVNQRTREIGVRMALGADAKDIFKLIVGRGLLLTSIGVGIGLALALVGTRLISSLLYSVSAIDPLTFAGVTLLLVAVAFLACYFPARRAMKTDPMVALRYE
ncbi:MAG TPA: ABC transporter permease [Blastocatellia bacterium]|nr:ABC transporter permease [Blastocatellia bacterium]